MSAGRTQLSGIGQQDMYLTGNPQITHFKAVYRRHTNFAVETYKLTFNTNPTEVDNTVEAFISKNGAKESKTSADRKRALQLQGGLTPLHVAAMKGHTDFCRSVVQEGKQVNV